MGTDNVIYLATHADLAVPSYRRARRSAARSGIAAAADASGEGPWHALARQRGAHLRVLPATAARPTGQSPASGGAEARGTCVAAEPPAPLAAAPALPDALPDVGGAVAPAARSSGLTTVAAWRPGVARVRVAQPVDAAASHGLADGRVRISGRLTDVCAELERLAAAEAAAVALARRA